MKIAIIGTGGVGGYFGAKLLQAGNDVSFLARGKHLETIKTKGLEVKSILGDFTTLPVKATDNVLEMETPDLVLMCVKTWQVKDLAICLKSIIHPNTVIIPLQNGVSASEEIKGNIGNAFVTGGLCRIISKIEAPGIIRHFGVEPEIIFGAFPGDQIPRLQEIKHVFDEAGIKNRISNYIQADLWKKYISICVSGLLAVTRCTYGELREQKETRELMVELISEIYNLAIKIGIKIDADFVLKTIVFIDSFPHDATSSLTRDVWEGKPSEIEYQNGTVYKLGLKHGVPTPVNRFVYFSILNMERKARKS
jgi:2-dehydropantoate 2-reductase